MFISCLIRPLLNHLSVYWFISSSVRCTSFSIFTQDYTAITSLPSPSLMLCPFPALLCLPLSVHQLPPLLWGEWDNTIELITAIQSLYLCLFREQQRAGNHSPHLHTATQLKTFTRHSTEHPHNYTPDFCVKLIFSLSLCESQISNLLDRKSRGQMWYIRISNLSFLKKKEKRLLIRLTFSSASARGTHKWS